jgi:hypothetical protein
MNKVKPQEEQIDEEMNSSSYGEEVPGVGDPEILDAIQQMKIQKIESHIRRKEDESMEHEEEFFNMAHLKKDLKHK